ncbi:MAG: cytochrome c-type biogenesis protein CcmH, partial [Myxococcota bacterium]
ICGFSDRMRKEIDAMIGAGMTKPEIFDALVKRYGSRVLASPGSSDWLDRVAWVGPFAALIIGALFLVRVIRRLVARPAGESPAPEPAATEAPARTGYEQKLEEELSRFES